MLQLIPNNNQIKNKSYLVTGGAGFIGSNLVAYLLQQGAKEVRVLDNLATGSKNNIFEFETDARFKFILGDITNYQDCLGACQNMDGVFHNAALGSVSRSLEDPIATNHANVNGFVTLLNAAKNQGVKKIIYASSSSVYGDDASTEKQEHITGNLLSPYAVSKKTNELYAAVFTKSYNLPIIGLRYFNVFGPKQNPNGQYAAVIPIFISQLLKNKAPSIFGDGTTSRDFTYIDNVVYANVLAMTSDVATGVYNVAYGASTSLNTLYKIIQQKVNASAEAQYKPERKGDIKNSLANITCVKNDLGYKPLISIEQGLEFTIDWYKQIAD